MLFRLLSIKCWKKAYFDERRNKGVLMVERCRGCKKKKEIILFGYCEACAYKRAVYCIECGGKRDIYMDNGLCKECTKESA